MKYLSADAAASTATAARIVQKKNCQRGHLRALGQCKWAAPVCNFAPGDAVMGTHETNKRSSLHVSILLSEAAANPVQDTVQHLPCTWSDNQAAEYEQEHQSGQGPKYTP